MRSTWHRVLVMLCLCGSGASTAAAHGFGQRYDLPVPLWLYLTGAVAAVVCSFLIIGVFVRRPHGSSTYPRLNLLRWPPGRLLAHSSCLLCLRLIAVFLFILLILDGLLGNQHPIQNLAPTLVWIVWWVGLAYVSALGGNLWEVINPWKTLFTWVEFLAHRVMPTRELTLHLPYPRSVGQWPGVLLFLVFAWTELVFEDSAVPAKLAIMVLVYSGITWTGMVLFGTAPWLRYGEAFSIAFGLLARFAPTEVRVIDPRVCQTCNLDCRDQDGACINCAACFERAAGPWREWNLRPFAAGLLRHQSTSTSEMAFVLVLLATVTFDGFLATPLWLRLEDALQTVLPDLGSAPDISIKTLGLVAFPVLFLGFYRLFCGVMAIVSGRRLSGATLARAFVLTLMPIALAYHMAHYFSFLLIQGQFIIPLLSDPFGVGWNLLGTAGYHPNIGIVGARFAWFTAVIAIVVGHIVAVYLAHLVALRTWREYAPALRSQYPMLVLMVGYTLVSLWILSQPIVERGAHTPVVTAAAPSGGVMVPGDALLPEPGSGVLREVGTGHTAAAKITYRVLTSAFHDGTRMTIADVLYSYIFAYRWGMHQASGESRYDPTIARATALVRERLVGLKVLRVERTELGIGELKLVRNIPIVDVYVNHTAIDTSQVAALAPPWSSLPWHLTVLMEEAVQRGWAAFSATEAQRRGVPWLDLVRDQGVKEKLDTLVQEFARQRFIPQTLQPFVTVGEAQQRWSTLHTFFQTQGHFLVTNGPYRLSQWSASTVVLQAFRDASYPLGVGSYDRTALPRRAYISQITPRDHGLEIRADVERVNKFQRTYEIVRVPLGRATPSDREEQVPLCRYVVVHADGSVARTGTAQYTGDGVYVVDLRDKLKPGMYTILVALYLHENSVNPEIKKMLYRVDELS